MRLIKANITNFGSLRDIEIDLGDDLLQFSEDNGYGKTTICAFIKAMFYGLPIYKTNSKFNDRARYTPFTGSTYGGSLEFEWNGKNYRILRNFDGNMGKKDTLTVLCKNKATDELGEVPGITVFGIDDEAFERTLFIEANAVDLAPNTTIITSLGGIVEGTDDEDIKNVIAKLNSKVSGLNGTRSNSDKEIPKLKGQILDLLTKESLLSQYEKNVSTINKDYLEKKALFDNLNKQYEEARIMKSWKAYDEMDHLSNQKLAEAKKIQDKYNGNMPTKEDLEKLNTSEKTIEINNSKIKDSTFELEDRLVALKEQYKDFTKPSEIALSEMEEHATRIKLMEEDEKAKAANKKMPLLVPGIIIAVGIILVIAGLFMDIVLKAVLVGVGVAAMVLGIVLVVMSLMPEKGGYRPADKNYELAILNMAMSKYGDYKDIDGYKRLLTDVAAFDEIAEIEAKKVAYENKIDSLKQQITDAERDYKILLETHNMEENVDSQDVQKDIATYESFIASSNEYREKAQQIKDADGLSERPETIVDVDLKKINLEITSAANDMTELKKLLDTNLSQIEETKARVAQLPELKEQLAALEENYNVLNTTKELLESAYNNVKNQYITPVKESFDNYSKALEKAIGSKIHINENYQLSYEENNELHDINHLSAGEKSIVYLCLRLAFIDNMFKVNKPFIVLDDPFVYLDKKHFNKVKSLLNDLSYNEQIIYFTCHDSRKVL